MYRVLILATAFWLVAGTTAFSLPTYCDRALFAGRRPSAPQILPPAKARARHVAMRMTYEVFFWDNSLSDPSTSSPLGEVISDLVVVGIGGRNTELGEYLFRLAPCVSKADDTSRAVWYFVPLCSHVFLSLCISVARKALASRPFGKL